MSTVHLKNVRFPSVTQYKPSYQHIFSPMIKLLSYVTVLLQLPC